jgi:Ca-activated chloride channel homolog
VKTKHFFFDWSWLVVLAGLILGVFSTPGRADGFIAVSGSAEVPRGHFPFAPLEVSYHRVNVKINGQICTTTVDEEFYNPNNRVLEGTYLFPVPKTAQIDKFTMNIGGKDVAAELLAADKARAIYEDIVRKQRDPALLEYADRSVFKVRIFPIEARSRKQVRIVYTEVLKSDSGLVSYLYPLNTEKFSAALIKEVKVRVELDNDQPLTSIYSPTHDVTISRSGDKHATVEFKASNVRPDTDFQILFAPRQREVALDLLTYRTSDDEGYFLLLATPGTLANATRPVPKDIAFVLDTSGSMADGKLDQAKKALQFCVANLNPDDRFEIIRFNDEATPLFSKLTPAKDKALAEAREFVARLKPNGGTNIHEALAQAIALRPDKSERPYVIIFLTDGLPTVGETSEEKIVAESARAADRNTRIFCFGLGNDVNARLLDRIVEKTRAASDYVLPTEDIEVKVSNFFGKIREPVLSNVKLTFPDGVKATKFYPQALPDLFRGEQLVLCGRYKGSASGDCLLEGTADGKALRYKLPVTFSGEAGGDAFIGRLWASRRVAYLLDEIRLHGENKELKDEVTQVAREFGLVTPYTAYLIMEDEQRRHVASENQVMRELNKDREAQSSARVAYDTYKMQVSGEAAVANARSQNSMKQAKSAADSLAYAQSEAARAMKAAPSASLPQQAGYRAQVDLSRDANTRVVQYTQNARFVAGRAFYQNGSQWIDSNVSTLQAGKTVRLKFGSQEYFDFISQNPQARPYIALGQNVKLAVKDTVYDIYDETAVN